MEKKRTITIQHPRLLRLRNILREVIFRAKLLELETLRKENKSLTIEDDLEQIKYLSDKMDKLRAAWKKSICTCSLCGSRTSDMTFNTYFKDWFCVKCYEKNQHFYRFKAKEGEIWYDENASHVPSTKWYP